MVGSLIHLIIVVAIFVFVIACFLQKDNKPGCNLDCDKCPFPHCSRKEKERMIKEYDLCNR